MNERRLKFTLNGVPVCVDISTDTLLVDLLRDKLGFTGTKVGCREGQCGACTVLMNGKAVNSCLVLALSVEGSKITTIEGLEDNGEIHPLQKTFIEKGAVQCGFCTPGMILSAKALLDGESDPSEEQVKVALSGNLCRCTGYSKIIEAVQDAARQMKIEGGKEDASKVGR